MKSETEETMFPFIAVIKSPFSNLSLTGESSNKPTTKIRFNENTIINKNDESTLVKKEKSGHEMKIYLENALQGIKNLKETYATCSQTCARIDVVVNKIEHVLNGASNI